MSRITLTDDAANAVFKLAEGNPGAIRVCCEMLLHGSAIDPDACFGPWAHLLALDTSEIYGPRIWRLFKDICDSDLVKVIGLLRSVQLGYLGESALRAAIDGSAHLPEGEVTALVDRVREHLPRFCGAATTTATVAAAA